KRLASRRLLEGLTGIRQLHELIAEHAEEPDQVVIGIETDRGLWAGALAAAAYQVRTDRHNHRPIAGDSLDAEAIKVLARAHQSLIWARTRHTNAMRSALR